MTQRILGPTGSSRRRRILPGAVLVAALLAILLVPGALAVHDEAFQLDGNTAVDGGPPPFDWESFFNSSGQRSPVLPDASRPGFSSSGFTKDFSRNANGTFNSEDETTFTTGSKDTLNISPGWQCVGSNNVTDKDTILNAYAVGYTDPVSGDQFIYFGLERFANNGDANIAFWFLQDGSVSCTATGIGGGGTTSFSGVHKDGDLLIVSAFTNGGNVTNIDAYRWTGNSPGALQVSPKVASGADCRTASAGDPICARSNLSLLTPIWDTARKVGGKTQPNLDTSEFFEGGINLTQAGLAGECFHTFMGVTRSSQSLTATLFDYALGSLPQCTATVATVSSRTTCVINSCAPVTDTATITGSTSGSGTAPTPTGTVTFSLCKTGGSCSAVSTETLPNPGPPGGVATATSDDASGLISGLGEYCFKAVWDPGNDPNYKGQGATIDGGANECFTVTDVASTVTHQNWLPNDSATITSAGGSTIAGSVTFTLYRNGTCTAGTNNVNVIATFPNRPVVNGTASTDNSTTYVAVSPGATISWRAVFTSSNGVGSGSPSTCESSVLQISD